MIGREVVIIFTKCSYIMKQLRLVSVYYNKDPRRNLISVLKIVIGLFVLLNGSNAQGPKKVFAHYMVGFAFPSDQNFFDSQIKRAKSAGIDGFALNVGSNDWQPDR